MRLSSILRGVTLTARSFAFIYRNGTKPDGRLKICRAVVDIPPESYELYRSLVQMETTRLEMPRSPRMVLNLLEVSDPGYREFQVMIRAAYKGTERWYLNHILINNFIGWIYGLKDYGYNKYLYPVDFEFSEGDRPFRAEVPAKDAYLRAYFRKDPSAVQDLVDDDGSYSVKSNKLIFCKAGTSSVEEISMDHGYLEVIENSFEANKAGIDYPTEWSKLIPLGPHRANLFVGEARDVAMEPMEVLETW